MSLGLELANLLVSSSSPKSDYRRRFNEKKTSVHWGQRKLLLSEIQFLSLFLDSSLDNPIVVYAGAAPGIHIKCLSKLFPMCTFHLYDPRKFAIDLHNGIKVFTNQRVFTDDDAHYWSTHDNVYFISDIRTADYRKMSKDETEQYVHTDMQDQQRWYEIINPVNALMKFRLPWPDRWPTETYSYLFGYVFIQAWAPQTSTECRLSPVKDANGNSGMFDWNIREYESVLFHHNSIIREETKFNDGDYDSPELLDDFDSMAEVFILQDYLLKFPSCDVITLSRQITDELNYHLPQFKKRCLNDYRH